MPVEEKKKFSKSYQPKNPQTNEPIGPPQVFEADTREELIDKIAAAHENASVRLYEVKRAAAVGAVMDFDPDKPLRKFEERQLTADEKIRIGQLMNDANTRHEAVKIMIEAQLGASVAEVRDMLTQQEVQRHIEFIRTEVDAWLTKHPEYIQSDSNRDLINKWLQKQDHGKGVPATQKNLEIAYETLTADGLLVIRNQKQEETPVVTAPIVSAQPTTAAPVVPVTQETPPAAETVPPSSPAIPGETTSASAITETPEQVRARTSSSGLGRNNSSVTPPEGVKPKTVEITFAEINAMTSVKYAEACKNPAFKAAVEKLYAGRASK